MVKIIAAGGGFTLVGAIVLLATGMVTPGLVAVAGTVFLFTGVWTARRAFGRFANPS
jgi:hypothetical protein